MFAPKSLVAVPSLMLLFAAQASAAPATLVTLDGDVQVATGLAGVEPSSLLKSSDAAKALEPKLAEIGACVGGVAKDVDGAHRVALDVDGAGKVTAVRTVESHVPEAAQKCADDALRTAQLPALSKADASATLTLTIQMKSAVEAKSEETTVAKTVEPLPAEGGAATSPPESQKTGAAQGAPQGGAKTEGADKAGPQLQASASTEKAEETRPYKLTAQLVQWIGQGTFVKDSFAATPDYGYLMGIGASYNVTDKISVGSKLVWLQQLTVTNKDNGTIPRELLFRDLTLGASAPKLYKEEFTGIDLGTGATLYFPISKASRAQQRIFGLGLRGTAAKTFEKLGPGDLALNYAVSFVKNFGPAAADNDPGKHPSGELCRGGNRDGNAGTCLTSNASNNYYLLNDFSVAYTFLEDWTIGVDFLIWNKISRDLSSSAVPTDLAAGSNIIVGRSPYSVSGTSQTDETVTTIELAYAVTKNITVAAELYTFQPMFIQSGSNSRALRFPFWDFRSAAENYSSFNLDVAFTY